MVADWNVSLMNSRRFHHLYADDTQLFISFSPDSFSESIDHHLHVVKQILLGDLKFSMPEPLNNWIYTHRPLRTTKENPRPTYFP